MNEDVVISVHYNSVVGITDDYLVDYHGYTQEHIDRYWRGWSWSNRCYKLSVEAALKCKEEAANAFKTKFIDHIIPGVYYQFIITPPQERTFYKDITSTGFDKHLIYKSPIPGINTNYPEEGPKLTVYLFYVPKEN